MTVEIGVVGSVGMTKGFVEGAVCVVEIVLAGGKGYGNW